jgi:hypothetical protein
MTPTSIQWLVITWFAVSGFAAVLGRFTFGWWIWKRGARLDSLWIATPGYLEVVYTRWCREQGRSPRTGIVVLVGSLINAALAIAAFFVVVVQAVPR